MSNQPTEFTLIGADALKAAFRRHASGVAIVTAATAEGAPIGFTATSVTSMGSIPPLASFNIAQGSSSYPHLKPGSKVAVHILTEDNLALAQLMAGPKEQRFSAANFDWVDGVPVFRGTSAVMIGQVRTRVEVEANAVVVLDILTGAENEDASPLLYYQRGYLTTGKRLADNF